MLCRLRPVEFDEFLEEQKDDLSKKKLMTCTDVLETRRLEKDIDQADQEVIDMTFV